MWNASVINGYAIAANDGRLGTVSDFLFDDASWLVRWLPSIPANGSSVAKFFCPVRLGHLDPKGHEFSVELTVQQVKGGQYIDTDRPVSRLMETPAGECAQQTFRKTADTQPVANNAHYVNAHYVKDNRAPACLPVISSDLYKSPSGSSKKTMRQGILILSLGRRT